jgi:hypothetical protein
MGAKPCRGTVNNHVPTFEGGRERERAAEAGFGRVGYDAEIEKEKGAQRLSAAANKRPRMRTS